MFKRRNPRTYWQSFVEFFAPRSGWRRAINYMSLRLKRLPDTPHRIALGFACGAYVCFSPFFGLHFFYAAGLAMIVRGNVIASLLGTFIGNPITFPFIGAASYRAGLWLLGLRDDESVWAKIRASFGDATQTIWRNVKSIFGYEQSGWEGFVEFFHTVLWPYFVGGSFMGIFGAIATYFISKPLIKAYQNRRKGRLLAKLKEIKSSKSKAADEV